MNNLREKPPWKGFDMPAPVPTSRTCPKYEPGCKGLKAHINLNDSIELLQQEYNELVEPKTVEDMDKKEVLRGMIDSLRKMERGLFGGFMLVSKQDCENAIRCRC